MLIMGRSNFLNLEIIEEITKKFIGHVRENIVHEREKNIVIKIKRHWTELNIFFAENMQVVLYKSTYMLIRIDTRNNSKSINKNKARSFTYSKVNTKY